MDQDKTVTQKVVHAGMVATGAAGVATAVVGVIVWVLSYWKIDVPNNVALDMATILTSLFGLILHRNLSGPVAPANDNAAPAVDPRTPLESAAHSDAPVPGKAA